VSANPVTTFDLVDANTMALAHSLVDATNRSFKPVFNGPGTFSCSLPLDSEAAYYVANRSVGAMITRNNRVIWSGGVTNVNKNATSNVLSLTATGWLEEFDHRYVRKSEEAGLIFSGATSGEIIEALIAACNAQLDTDGIVRPLRASFGSSSDTQTRNRTYRVGDNYGAAIRELMTIENGCDLRVDPLTRKITVLEPTNYADRREVRFGWGTEPHNLSDATETDDGTNLFNRENVVTSGGIVTSADDGNAIGLAGVMLEEWISLSDVSDVNIATAYANAELVVKRNGLTTYQIVPDPYGDVPRPYGDFEWGDKCYFSVDQGAFKVENQAVRVFAGTINYTDQGDEVIAELEVAMSG
jgi:hypothetical protein